MSQDNREEVPDEKVLFQLYMEQCYELPLELKNDIIYCQRAMRDFLKVHGLVSDVFKEQHDADPAEMRRILNELEAEVYEINAEQNFLMLLIEEDLNKFYRTLEEFDVQIVPELGNEYISSLIVPLIGDATYKIYPKSVAMRDDEEMLIRKHFLILPDDDVTDAGPVKLSEIDANVQLELQKPFSSLAITDSEKMTDYPELVELPMDIEELMQLLQEEDELQLPTENGIDGISESVPKMDEDVLAIIDSAGPIVAPSFAPAVTSKKQKTKKRNSNGGKKKTVTPPKPKPQLPPPSVAPKKSAKTPKVTAVGGVEALLDSSKTLESGQESFLKIFGLYTHDVVKKFSQRRSKRKRRILVK